VWHLHHPNKITIRQYNFDGSQIEEFGRYAVLTLTLPMLI
jgi:hypothetical protein